MEDASMNEELKELEEILNHNSRMINVLKSYFIDKTKIRFKNDIIECLKYVVKKEQEALNIVNSLR